MEAPTNLKKWRDRGETKPKKKKNSTQPNTPTEKETHQSSPKVMPQQPPAQSPWQQLAHQPPPSEKSKQKHTQQTPLPACGCWEHEIPHFSPSRLTPNWQPRSFTFTALQSPTKGKISWRRQPRTFRGGFALCGSWRTSCWLSTLQSTEATPWFKKKIKEKNISNNISNPYLFRGAPKVTTFVHLAGSRTKGVWSLIEKGSWVDIRLVEMEHPSLKKSLSYCSSQVPVYVHPSFYRALKLKYPLDVRDVSRDGWITTELGTSLRHAVGISTHKDFCAAVNSE